MNRKNPPSTLRTAVLAYAKQEFGTDAEYLWASAPDFAVLRRADNRKWYAILMDVPRNKLGLQGSASVDILDIKVDPLLHGSLLLSEGFLPAYHMHKGNWITVLLDGTVEREQIFFLLAASYELTAPKRRQKRTSARITHWIVPANPKYYDIESEIAESRDGIFLWKQSSRICVGDTVYLYLAAPRSAIRYRCKAVEVDIPYDYDDPHVHLKRAMRLQVLETYDREPISLELMKEYGVTTVRGPRGIPNSLEAKIRELYPTFFFSEKGK